MKSLVLLGLLLSVGTAVLAQGIKLSRDERGKLMYYEVVDKKDTAASVLAARAKAYFDAAKDLKVVASTGDSLRTVQGKFVIRKTAFMLARPSGEVTYNMYLGLREGKYRFWLTDFVFIPYQRDRYGNFVPSTTIGTPLETEPGKLNAAEWESYVSATEKSAAEFARQFKQHMSAVSPATPRKKEAPVISTQDKKW